LFFLFTVRRVAIEPKGIISFCSSLPAPRSSLLAVSLFLERQDKIEQVPVCLGLAAHHAAVNLDYVLHKIKTMASATLSTAAHRAETFFKDATAFFAAQRLARREEIEPNAWFIFSESALYDLLV
jgi:hypothetical protein